MYLRRKVLYFIMEDEPFLKIVVLMVRGSYVWKIQRDLIESIF